MSNFEKKIEGYIRKHRMLTRGDKIVLGVSGGADSVALLEVFGALRESYDLKLHAVHVHHGIRAEAWEDAAYAEKLCGERNVAYTLVEKDIPKLSALWKISEEEAGRRVRYQAFADVLAQELTDPGAHGRIAVAHHRSDQAETVLHNLFRGTGLAGLRGMLPQSGPIIRPFLCVSRQEIEDYLAEKKIGYRIDRTNDSDDYTRNRIRHHVLEYAVRQINAEAAEHVAQTAELVQEAESYIRHQAEEAWQECREDSLPMALSLSKLREKDSFLQKQVILLCLERLMPGRRDITAAHVTGALELMEKEGEKSLNLPGNLRIVKQYDTLSFLQGGRVQDSGIRMQEWLPRTVIPPCNMAVPGFGTLELRVVSLQEAGDGFAPLWQKIPENPYTKWFDYDKINQPVQLRTRKQGDYLCINDSLARKSLKDYMIQEKIPKSKRDEQLLLADGSHILWVIGRRISAEYKVSVHTKHILEVNLRGGS